MMPLTRHHGDCGWARSCVGQVYVEDPRLVSLDERVITYGRLRPVVKPRADAWPWTRVGDVRGVIVIDVDQVIAKVNHGRDYASLKVDDQISLVGACVVIAE